MKSATERWLRVGMALVAVVAIIYFFLASGGESRREFVRRQNQEFNEFIRGEIRWIDDINGRDKVYYLRVDSASAEQYDSRDSAMGYPYAVVRDTCAAVVEFQKGKEVGDILEVRGSTDSVYVYREERLVYSGVRTVSNYEPFIEDAKSTIDMSRCKSLGL